MPKYRIVQSGVFKKDLKKAIKRGYNIDLLAVVVDTIAAGDALPEKYKDHCLTGNFQGCRECHITPAWLLLYKIADDEVILYLTRTGTHGDLF